MHVIFNNDVRDMPEILGVGQQHSKKIGQKICESPQQHSNFSKIQESNSDFSPESPESAGVSQNDTWWKSPVHLVVTSPPYYNAKTEYVEYASYADYIDVMHEALWACWDVLADAGRLCINVANYGRNPYRYISDDISCVAEQIGFKARGEIIWDKGASAGGSTAWGSWMSPSNPSLRDVHEYIQIYSKGEPKMQAEGRQPSITRDDFLESTKSVWHIQTESAKRVGHPAPFPLEIPRRLIELYSYVGDTVLDPFCGSGTTGVAAIGAGRNFIGFDTSAEYCALAEDRIQASFQLTDCGQ